jgi:hypothetical protein
MTLTPITGVDLAGKTVQLHQRFFKAGLLAEDNHFKCEGGFGCSPCAMGQKIFGVFADGEEAHVNRFDVEGIVT